MMGILTSDSRETAVIPTTHEPFVDKLMKFTSLCVYKVQATETSCQLWREKRWQLKSEANHLKSQTLTGRILRAWIIHWYCGLQSRYSFVLNAFVIPSRESTTGHAKCWVYLPFSAVKKLSHSSIEQEKKKNDLPCSMLQSYITPIYDRIVKRLVRVIHAHLDANTPMETFLGACLQRSEALQVVISRIIAMFRCNAVHPFLTHLGLLCIFGVGFAWVHKFKSEAVQVVEVVWGVSDFVAVEFLSSD